MRIIAGEKRGTKLFAPKGETIRPTTDRVKEAMFGSLQFLVPGAAVLDLFAGSGALGLEAASRGAAQVVMADSDAEAVALIQKNFAKAGAPQSAQILKNDFLSTIKLFQNSQKFDIVFIDPPYGSGFYGEAVQKLVEMRALHTDAVLVLESDRAVGIEVEGVLVEKTKKFGDTVLTFCKYEG